MSALASFHNQPIQPEIFRSEDPAQPDVIARIGFSSEQDQVIKELEISDFFSSRARQLVSPSQVEREHCITALKKVSAQMLSIIPHDKLSSYESSFLSFDPENIDRPGQADYAVRLKYLCERKIPVLISQAASEDVTNALQTIHHCALVLCDFSARLLLGTQPSELGSKDLYFESVAMIICGMQQAGSELDQMCVRITTCPKPYQEPLIVEKASPKGLLRWFGLR